MSQLYQNSRKNLDLIFWEPSTSVLANFVGDKNIDHNGYRLFLPLLLSHLSFSQIEARAVCLGAGLSHLGIPTGPETNVGVFAPNSIDVSLKLPQCD